MNKQLMNERLERIRASMSLETKIQLEAHALLHEVLMEAVENNCLRLPKKKGKKGHNKAIKKLGRLIHDHSKVHADKVIQSLEVMCKLQGVTLSKLRYMAPVVPPVSVTLPSQSPDLEPKD